MKHGNKPQIIRALEQAASALRGVRQTVQSTTRNAPLMETQAFKNALSVEMVIECLVEKLLEERSQLSFPTQANDVAEGVSVTVIFGGRDGQQHAAALQHGGGISRKLKNANAANVRKHLHARRAFNS